MSNWTPEQLQRLVARGMVDARDLLPKPQQPATVPLAPKPGQDSGTKAPKKPRGRAEMNKTESAFARILESRVLKGEFDSFEREGITLRWPDGMAYSPDFVAVKWVQGSKGTDKPPMIQVTFFETKGPFIHEDALVKFRAARSRWELYRFEMHQLVKGEWTQIL